MALLLERSVFIHMAKTGGTWMTDLFKRARIVRGGTAKPHLSLPQARRELKTDLPGFVFVRHPVTWWRSYWAYKMKGGWDPNHALDVACRADAFPEFMRNVLDKHPGYFSRRLREMTEGVRWIGRFERLRESLVAILGKAGEGLPTMAVHNARATNEATKDYLSRLDLPQEMLCELYAQEQEAFRTFGYGLGGNTHETLPVIWMTGLPASGKTTTATRVVQQLSAVGIPSELLDGDELRKTVSADLGYDEESRRLQTIRAASLAAELVRKGVVPVVALVSPYSNHRAEARERVGAMIEVYIRCSLGVCMDRDPKGLYRKARAGEIDASTMTGMGAPYEPPIAPEATIDTTTCTPEEAAALVVDAFQAYRLCIDNHKTTQ